jgi:hypothetical protein
MWCDAEDVDVTSGDLEYEEYVDALKRDRAVNMEEIAGQQCRSLGPQEPPPRGVRFSLWRWRDPQTFEHASDGRGGYPMAELEQLALNPAISPVVVSRAIRSINATMVRSMGGRPVRLG